MNAGGYVGGHRNAVNATTPFKVQDIIFCYRTKQKEHGNTDKRQQAQPAHNS